MHDFKKNSVIDSDRALRNLIEGNERFVACKPLRPHQTTDQRFNLAKGQKPWAIVLGCMDSRVPPEMIFDQGFGDMLVVRTAGHVVDCAALGSIEFAIEEFPVSLVMVLGHQNCGAVCATVEMVNNNIEVHGAICAIVQRIQPAVDLAKRQAGELVANAVRNNIAWQAEQLRSRSENIARAANDRRIRIVGALYALDSGKVEIITP